jgi:protein SCO1/2
MSSRTLHWVVWGSLGMVLAIITTRFLLQDPSPSGSSPPPANLPIYGQVQSFSLTNQLGIRVGLEQLRGKPWIADIIFTRCTGPCSQMTERMAAIQDALPADSPVRFVSLTADPEYDTPPRLAAYATRFGADTNRWDFLTGTKSQIAKLAVDELKLVLKELAPEERAHPEDLFLHSTLFVLVDAEGRLRAAIEGLEAGATAKAVEAVNALLAAPRP